MQKAILKSWSTRYFIFIVVVTLIVTLSTCEKNNSNRFETVRTHIQTWLSEIGSNDPIISSSDLKKRIVDDWDNQQGKYQIVSVRKPEDYKAAGHIPHSINIYWVDVIRDKSLNRLDSSKTQILYCYYGHGSMISYTILNLLGYNCYSLNFGMMDWNLDALVKQPYDQKADYEVEYTVNRSNQLYPVPVIMTEQIDAKSIIKEMAKKYLSGEGSPVIRSSDVKAIIEDWDHKKIQYQLIDVRSKSDYEAGHVPRSINIPWAKIAAIENLKKLEPKRTIIVYSENGQTGQLATTVLSLLGYRAVNMLFGMMDWYTSYVDSKNQWDGVASYPIVKENMKDEN